MSSRVAHTAPVAHSAPLAPNPVSSATAMSIWSNSEIINKVHQTPIRIITLDQG